MIGRGDRWSAIRRALDELRDDGGALAGRCRGIALRVTASPFRIEAADPIDDRFTLAITPRGDRGGFEERFAVHAVPHDLARSVLDDGLRAALCTLDRPRVELAPGQLLTLEAARADPRAVEIVAGLAQRLVERGLMCARG